MHLYVGSEGCVQHSTASQHISVFQLSHPISDIHAVESTKYRGQRTEDTVQRTKYKVQRSSELNTSVLSIR